MTKCLGCGQKLPDSYDKALCERCFKIKHYNQHDIASIEIDNDKIISSCNAKKYATLFLCDILTLNEDLVNLYNQINEPKYLVITKMDLIPKNVSLNVLADNIARVYGISKLIFTSVMNGFGKKDILAFVKKYSNVNIVGPTSSGKSSLINSFYGANITVSNKANTTQQEIQVKCDNGILIDYPGFVINSLNEMSKEAGYIKPKVVFLKKGYVLVIKDKEIYADRDINITLYLPKDIIFKTMKIRRVNVHNLDVNKHSELVIIGQAVLYFKKSCQIAINDLADVSIRESIMVAYE